MKKYIILLLLFIPTTTCFGQIVGVAGQWTNFDKYQFHATANFPYKTSLGDNTCWMLSGGADYLSGTSKISGLNIKPVQFAITNSDIFGTKKYTAMLGMDAGYNFNFNRSNDGIILTPNIYLDYRVFYMKVGYDYNTFENEGQFFVRLGIGAGIGFFKMFKR